MKVKIAAVIWCLILLLLFVNEDEAGFDTYYIRSYQYFKIAIALSAVSLIIHGIVFKELGRLNQKIYSVYFITANSVLVLIGVQLFLAKCYFKIESFEQLEMITSIQGSDFIYRIINSLIVIVLGLNFIPFSNIILSKKKL
jgi:hypothetical protein